MKTLTFNAWKLIFGLALVSGWRAEEVKCRRSDGWNGVGAQRSRKLLTEAAHYIAPTNKARTSRPDVASDGAGSAKASQDTSGLLVRATLAKKLK